MKKREGNALLNLMERDRNISLPSTNNGFSGKIIRAITLNTIIEARMKEIFELVKNSYALVFGSLAARADFHCVLPTLVDGLIKFWLGAVESPSTANFF